MIQKVIAGIPRSGKSTACKAIINGSNISYIPFDSIISTLYDVFPDLKISHFLDSQEVSKKIAPFIKSLTKHLMFERMNFVIDVYQLFPIDIIADKTEGIEFYFFGYPEIDIESKIEQIRQFSTPGSWVDDLTDSELMPIIRKYKKESKIIKKQCIEYNLPFIDMSFDFTSSLKKAVKMLIT